MNVVTKTLNLDETLGGNRSIALPLLVSALCGGAAACAIALEFFKLRLGPGHQVLTAAIPFGVGLALMPTRFSGILAGLGAAATIGMISVLELSKPQQSGMVGLFVLGPALDLALSVARKRPLATVACCVLAGWFAGSLAFLVRSGLSVFELDLGVSHVIGNFGWSVYEKFSMFGAIAGLLCGLAALRGTSRAGAANISDEVAR